MTPDLLQKGAERVARVAQQRVEATESGGRSAGYGRVVQDASQVDVTHGRILYLEDVSVSFDGRHDAQGSIDPQPRRVQTRRARGKGDA